MKRFVSLLLVIGIIICAVPFGAFTFTASAIGVSGDYTYTVSNGKATITEVDTFISGDVTIPSTLGGYSVIEIDDSAFKDCDNIITVTIPNSVKSIGDTAFGYCDSLTSITIGSGVTKIGSGAFYKCYSLTSVIIPDSVTIINDYAFYDCTGLKDVSIGSGIKSIGSEAFNKCNNLESVYITDIVNWCKIKFYSYTANPIANSKNVYLNGKLVTDLVIPEDITVILEYAFAGYSSLKSVTLPKSITYVSSEAFYNCTGIRYVYYKGSQAEKANVSIGWRNTNLENATWYCNSCVAAKDHNCGEWTIQKEPNCIEAGSKYKTCSSCGEIITEVIDATGEHTYDNADDATCNICGLFTGTISGTTGECIWTLSGTQLTISGNGVMGDYSNNHSPWYDKEITAITIEDGVKSIGDCAFSYCYGITTITIPDSVESIGFRAFWNCINLTNIEIGNGVTNIWQQAFEETDYYNCTTNWQNGVLYIDEYLIEAKTYISGNYTVLNGTRVIAACAFWYCHDLTGITVPDGVVTIGYSAFADCDGLISVTLPDSVKNIGKWAFSDCYELTNVTLGNNVTSIVEGTFYECYKLTSIVIPDSVKSIGDDAFYACIGLKSVTIGKNVVSIGDRAFENCYELTSIIIPDSVTKIGEEAFAWCNDLVSVIIGNGVTHIGDCAFYACSDLTGLIIGKSVTYIGVEAFGKCTSLVKIIILNIVVNIDVSAFNGCGDLIIYGYSGSNVEAYANNKHITFVAICYGMVEKTVDKTGVYVFTSNNMPSVVLDSKNIVVLDEKGTKIKYNNTKNGWPLVAGQRYYFVLNIEYNITITLNPSFKKLTDTIFYDTSSKGWYNDAVTFSVGQGIMNGKNANTFGTNENLQRQDFIVIFARLAGIDESQNSQYNYNSNFTDVNDGYYRAAVNWAVEEGITTGYTDGPNAGKFGVGDNITREQIVTLLYRYAQKISADMTVSDGAEATYAAQFSDFGRVSDFAEDAIIWALDKGVITGRENKNTGEKTIAPQGNASRAEIAKIMYNIYLNNIF